MSLDSDFKNSFKQYLKSLESFKSPFADLQSTMAKAAQPYKSFQAQIQESLEKYQTLQNNQVSVFQNKLAEYQKSIQINQPFQEAFQNYQNKNNELLNRIGGIQLAFELPNSYKTAFTKFDQSIGSILELQKKQQSILTTLNIQEEFAEKFNSLANRDSDQGVSTKELEVIDNLLTDIEIGIRFHLESTPETTQLSY